MVSAQHYMMLTVTFVVLNLVVNPVLAATGPHCYTCAPSDKQCRRQSLVACAPNEVCYKVEDSNTIRKQCIEEWNSQVGGLDRSGCKHEKQITGDTKITCFCRQNKCNAAQSHKLSTALLSIIISISVISRFL